MRRTALLLFVSLFIPAVVFAQCPDCPKEPTRRLIRELSRSADPSEIKRIFADPRLKLDRSILPRVYTKKELEKRIQETWDGLLSGKSLQRGLDYLSLHRDIFEETERIYGVDRYAIAAILRNETYFGRIIGKNRRAFNSMYSNYILVPRRRRFFAEQISCFLEIAKKNGWDIFEIFGSASGAFGFAQFMSCSYIALAVDGDGDGVIDLFTDADSIASIANYLSSSGWRLDQKRAILAYNPSDLYVSMVTRYREMLIDAASPAP